MIFVDSSAWVALYWEEDRFHRTAVGFWEQAVGDGVRLLTSGEVIGESASVLLRRSSLTEAVRFGDVMWESRLVTRLDLDEAVRRSAWERFRTQSGPPLSYMDCTSMALMHRHGIRTVFTFDEDFRAMGFEMQPSR